MEDGYVLVIGSSGIDIKGRPWEAVKWDIPNPGRVRNSVGGAARNIAENLARLEVPTLLLTALGKDSAARRIVRTCEKVGIDCSYARHIPNGRTGSYMALLHPDGQLQVAVSDFEIMDHLDPDYILEHEYLIEDAALVVVDATLPAETLKTVFDITESYQVRVIADPTSPELADKLCPFFSQIYMIVPNAYEIDALCDVGKVTGDRERATKAAKSLVTAGVDIAVVTLGAEGLTYADKSGVGYIRAINTKVVDTTGAGDAFTGAVIFGLLNGVPVDEAMRLGVTAASLTLESRHTVLPNISQELLYDKLTV